MRSVKLGSVAIHSAHFPRLQHHNHHPTIHLHQPDCWRSPESAGRPHSHLTGALVHRPPCTGIMGEQPPPPTRAHRFLRWRPQLHQISWLRYVLHKGHISQYNSHLALVPFKAWFETWTSTILGTVVAPPFAIAAFVVSELLYYGLVWVFYGWHHLGTYKDFHDRLHTHFRKMGHGAVETTKDGITNGLANVYNLVSLCFSTSQVEDAREDPDRIDNQARLPPPYWVSLSPLLFHSVPFHGLTSSLF